jgi:hypothetical protein
MSFGRATRLAFEKYQSLQSFGNRPRLAGSHWASFVVGLDGETLLAGLYATSYGGILETDIQSPHTEGIEQAESCDVYNLTSDERLSNGSAWTTGRVRFRNDRFEDRSVESCRSLSINPTYLFHRPPRSDWAGLRQKELPHFPGFQTFWRRFVLWRANAIGAIKANFAPLWDPWLSSATLMPDEL